MFLNASLQFHHELNTKAAGEASCNWEYSPKEFLNLEPFTSDPIGGCRPPVSSETIALCIFHIYRLECWELGSLYVKLFDTSPDLRLGLAEVISFIF